MFIEQKIFYCRRLLSVITNMPSNGLSKMVIFVKEIADNMQRWYKLKLYSDTVVVLDKVDELDKVVSALHLEGSEYSVFTSL